MPDVLLQLPNMWGFFLHSLWLSHILREKFLGAKSSGDLADQVMSPKYELKCPEKLALKQSIDPHVVYAVVPSWWNRAHHRQNLCLMYPALCGHSHCTFACLTCQGRAEVISTAQQVYITVECKIYIYDIQILNHRKMIPFCTSWDVCYLHQKNTVGMSFFYVHRHF